MFMIKEGKQVFKKGYGSNTASAFFWLKSLGANLRFLIFAFADLAVRRAIVLNSQCRLLFEGHCPESAAQFFTCNKLRRLTRLEKLA